MYTVSFLLPVSYIIGLIFTLKTHSHIYDIHIGDGMGEFAKPSTKMTNTNSDKGSKLSISMWIKE